MDDHTLELTRDLANQFPSLALFGTVLGLIVRAFLAHLKATASEHKEAMVEVVRLTSSALCTHTEAIFEHSRMVGAALQNIDKK